MAPDDCQGIGARFRRLEEDVEDGGSLAFVMTKSGAAPTSTYLRVHDIPTSQTGQIISGSPLLVGLLVSNTITVAHDTRVQLQRRTGQASFEDIAGAYVDILASNYKGSSGLLNIALGVDEEIAAYISSGDSLSNPVLTGFITQE